MTEIFLLTLYGLVAGLLLDWVCRSPTLRCCVYVALMATGITACTQLGEREFLRLDGMYWWILCDAVATLLLFKRSRYFERDRD